MRELRNKKWLIVLFIGGVLLLLLGSLPKKAAESTRNFDADAEKDALRAEVERLCRAVDGVGELSVVLYFPTGEEYVYAENTSGSGESYVTHSGDGLLLRIDCPRPAGVAVVCTGGDDPVIREALTRLLSSLLGIGANRIAVAKGNPRAVS